MLTRVIREMQLSLISMLTRSLTGRPNDGSAGSSSPPLKQQPHTMGGAQAAAAPEAPEAPEAPPKKKAKAAPERGTGLGSRRALTSLDAWEREPLKHAWSLPDGMAYVGPADTDALRQGREARHWLISTNARSVAAMELLTTGKGRKRPEGWLILLSCFKPHLQCFPEAFVKVTGRLACVSDQRQAPPVLQNHAVVRHAIVSLAIIIGGIHMRF